MRIASTFPRSSSAPHSVTPPGALTAVTGSVASISRASTGYVHTRWPATSRRLATWRVSSSRTVSAAETDAMKIEHTKRPLNIHTMPITRPKGVDGALSP